VATLVQELDLHRLLADLGLQTTTVLDRSLVLGVVGAGLHRLLARGEERVTPFADAGRWLADLTREGVEARATQQTLHDLGLAAS
jgi:hypothetical protein